MPSHAVTLLAGGFGSAGRTLPRRAAVYRAVFESPACSAAIFELGPGAAIPLHDHPAMGVCTRVLTGRLHAVTFEPHGADGAATCTSNAWYDAGAVFPTLPRGNNVHAFRGGATGAAILDIVFPPYAAGARDVTYFAWAGADGSHRVWDAAAGDGGTLRALAGEPRDWRPVWLDYDGAPVVLPPDGEAGSLTG